MTLHSPSRTALCRVRGSAKARRCSSTSSGASSSTSSSSSSSPLWSSARCASTPATSSACWPATCFGGNLQTAGQDCDKITKAQLGLDKLGSEQYWDLHVRPRPGSTWATHLQDPEPVWDEIKRARRAVRRARPSPDPRRARSSPYPSASSRRSGRTPGSTTSCASFRSPSSASPSSSSRSSCILLISQLRAGHVLTRLVRPPAGLRSSCGRSPSEHEDHACARPSSAVSGTGAVIMRFLRSQMLEVLRQDYVRTAWAKGLRERVIIVRHALKNALIPVLTIIGILLGTVVSGNVVLEYIYRIPGIGNYVVFAVAQNPDFPADPGRRPRRRRRAGVHQPAHRHRLRVARPQDQVQLGVSTEEQAITAGHPPTAAEFALRKRPSVVSQSSSSPAASRSARSASPSSSSSSP